MYTKNLVDAEEIYFKISEIFISLKKRREMLLSLKKEKNIKHSVNEINVFIRQ